MLKVRKVTVERLYVLGECSGCHKPFEEDRFLPTYRVECKTGAGWPMVLHYHPACWTGRVT